jgi:hypothetical protein
MGGFGAGERIRGPSKAGSTQSVRGARAGLTRGAGESATEHDASDDLFVLHMY